MVNRLWKGIAWLVPLTMFPSVSAITVDELRALAGQADRTQRERASRFKHGSLQGLLAKHRPSVKGEPTAKKAAIPVSPAPVEKPIVAQQKKTAPAVQLPTAVKSDIDEGNYVPPARVISEATFTTDAVMFDRKRYGINLGTWIKAELTRRINNLERGSVILNSQGIIQGKRRALATGTQFIAEKIYNPGTKRLEMRILKGVAPNGETFTLRANVYDLDKRAGLGGLVKTKKVVVPGFKRGLLRGGGRLVDELGTNNVFGSVMSTTANTIMNQKSQDISQSLTTQYIIYVNQQTLFIRVEESF